MKQDNLNNLDKNSPPTPLYVVRESYSPELDLQRDWSAPAGGGSICPLAEDSEEAAFQEWFSYTGMDDEVQARKEAPEFRFHNGLEAFCEVAYEGLGGFLLEAGTLEEALEEAKGQRNLAVTGSKGDGHFLAEEVESVHHVEGRIYVFKLEA